MRFAGFGILLVTAASMATGASATTLESTAGVVRVNQGDGFKPMSGTMRVRPGDRVLADGRGKGAVHFSDGCNVPMRSGSVFMVPDVSPCALKAQFPAAEAAAGSGGFGGLAGVAGIAGIAGVAGAAAVATVVTTGKDTASQQTNQQKQLIQAAILARPGPTSP